MNKEIYSVWLGGQCHSDTSMFTQAACILPAQTTVSGTQTNPKEKFKEVFTSIFTKCKNDGMEKATATAYALKHAQIETNTLVQPKLVGMKIYAGSNFVNGIDCVYSNMKHEENSNKQKSYGDHDDPKEYFLPLEIVENKIKKISIRYGDIIDGLTLTTRDGEDHVYGGTGGEFEEILAIPSEYELDGFYGGVGGHLHRLGVILNKFE